MLSARRSKEQAAGGRQWRCGGRDSVFGEGLGWVDWIWILSGQQGSRVDYVVGGAM